MASASQSSLGMEEELSNLCEGLRLTKDEEQEVHLSEDDVMISNEKSKKCLVALVVVDKDVNKGAFRATTSRSKDMENRGLLGLQGGW